ncbi:uncharacterized protein M421DRAFT_225437 [Didymella exigua CBS 183.55]|uniref:Uncharacterized protein n=1 Tax=Didymella exigua CBS 183.55 TaxID=1150837 RepID=A0A6A5RGC9_9PLEO|nr:uncharacterized protein M421DRAFT_225437 [Didymella exigua CBS 183.55]KAF1926134.1 hypothetical protein M421DRAFT_225437 [Didymella exigua CBS 183.55]
MLAWPLTRIDMEANYTDEAGSPLPQHAKPPPEQGRWDELGEYVGSSEDDCNSQDCLLDHPQRLARGSLQANPRGHLRDASQEHPQEHPQGHHQDHPQHMLQVRSFQCARLERYEFAEAEPSI